MKFKYIAAGAILMFVVTTFVACTVPQVTTNPDGSTSTNHVVDPKLSTGLLVARAANAASAPTNPSAPITELILGATAVGAGWFAKRKNDKAAANELLLKTLVQAVNTLDDGQKTKDAVQAHATRIGVEGELNTFVQKVESGLI